MILSGRSNLTDGSFKLFSSIFIVIFPKGAFQNPSHLSNCKKRKEVLIYRFPIKAIPLNQTGCERYANGFSFIENLGGRFSPLSLFSNAAAEQKHRKGTTPGYFADSFNSYL
jgi:hypothetical protein